MAVAKLGAVFLPIFSGYGVDAIAVRLQDADAKAIITATHAQRRGKPIEMAATAHDAAAKCPTVEHVIVVEEPGTVGRLQTRRSRHGCSTRSSRSSSRTRRAPQGARRARARARGFLVKIAEEVAFQFDCRAGDRLFWFADFGWIMGPWEIIARWPTVRPCASTTAHPTIRPKTGCGRCSRSIASRSSASAPPSSVA